MGFFRWVYPKCTRVSEPWMVSERCCLQEPRHGVHQTEDVVRQQQRCAEEGVRRRHRQGDPGQRPRRPPVEQRPRHLQENRPRLTNRERFE